MDIHRIDLQFSSKSDEGSKASAVEFIMAIGDLIAQCVFAGEALACNLDQEPLYITIGDIFSL